MDRQIYRKCHQLHQLLHRHRQTVKMSSQRHCPQLRYVALFSIFTHNFAFPLKIIMFCLFDFFVCIFKLIPAHHFNFTHKHQTFYLMQTVLIEKKRTIDICTNTCRTKNKPVPKTQIRTTYVWWDHRHLIIHKGQHVIRKLHRIQAQMFKHQIRLHHRRVFSIGSEMLMMTTIHLLTRLLLNR